MSKHTLGPWEILDKDELIDVKTGDTPFGIWAPESDDQPTIGHIDCEVSPDQIRANARLIAASPDGLIAAKEAQAALYGCREALGSIANIQHAIDLLEQFIAKAEGK